MKIFLSSTFLDLVDHRKAAAEAIERLGHQVGRLEVFGARPDRPSEACLAEIDECDLFVGIYAHRYGYVPDRSHESITEAEFDRANNNGKPLFCFLVDEEHPWPPKMIEGEPGKSKLQGFKRRLKSKLVRDTFTTPEDLAYKIAAALGWYFANLADDPPIATTASNVPNEYTDFFEKILSELASLRLEVQGQTDLLETVNNVGALLQTSEKNIDKVSPKRNVFPLDMEGCWIDSVTHTTLYAQFVDGELLVPYCYGGNSELTGVFFDFRQRSKHVFFARFKWTDSTFQGFAYLELWPSATVTGGWWFSEDVPKHELEDLERFDPNLPRMNELSLRREVGRNPKWVNDFFSTPKQKILNSFHTDT